MLLNDQRSTMIVWSLIRYAKGKRYVLINLKTVCKVVPVSVVPHQLPRLQISRRIPTTKEEESMELAESVSFFESKSINFSETIQFQLIHWRERSESKVSKRKLFFLAIFIYKHSTGGWISHFESRFSEMVIFQDSRIGVDLEPKIRSLSFCIWYN